MHDGRDSALPEDEGWPIPNMRQDEHEGPDPDLDVGGPGQPIEPDLFSHDHDHEPDYALPPIDPDLFSHDHEPEPDYALPSIDPDLLPPDHEPEPDYALPPIDPDLLPPDHEPEPDYALPPIDPDLLPPDHEPEPDYALPPIDPGLLPHDGEFINVRSQPEGSDSPHDFTTLRSNHDRQSAPASLLTNVVDAVDGAVNYLGDADEFMNLAATHLSEARLQLQEVAGADSVLQAAEEQLSRARLLAHHGRLDLAAYRKQIDDPGSAEFRPNRLPRPTTGSTHPEMRLNLDSAARNHLSLLLPQHAHLTEQVRVLSDPASGQNHREASLGIIRTLRESAQLLIDFSTTQRQFPRPSPEEAQQAEYWLRSLGISIDRGLRVEGFVWPPPGKDPPSIVADLLALYEATSSTARTSSDERTLGQILLEIETNAGYIVEHWSGVLADAVTSEVRSTMMSGRQPLFLRLTTNAALLITLLQAPTAALDFPEDAPELGRKVGRAAQVAYIATVDTASEILDRLSHLEL